jgi:molybdopterin synthase sulfur carrier subunit
MNREKYYSLSSYSLLTEQALACGLTIHSKRRIKMAIKVRIPTPLRKLTGGKADLQASGNTVKEVIDNLESQFPGFKENLCDSDGNLKRFVNIYLGDDNIIDLDKMNTAVKDGSELSLVPAIAGGRYIQ